MCTRRKLCSFLPTCRSRSGSRLKPRICKSTKHAFSFQGKSTSLAVGIVGNNSRSSLKRFCALLADSVGLAYHAFEFIIRARGAVEVREVLLEAERRSNVPAKRSIGSRAQSAQRTGPSTQKYRTNARLGLKRTGEQTYLGEIVLCTHVHAFAETEADR